MRDDLLEMLHALEGTQRDDGKAKLPAGYVLKRASDCGVFFAPADLAKNPRLRLPMFAAPDLSTPESRKIAATTWQARASAYGEEQNGADEAWRHAVAPERVEEPEGARTSTRIVFKP